MEWNKTLTKFLKKKGLEQIKSDKCIFRNKQGTLFLAIYVDDGLLSVKLIFELRSEFDKTITENPTDYLHIEISRGENEIRLSQTGYIQNLIRDFNMCDAKTMATPMDSENSLGEPLVNGDSKLKFPYRSAVGTILYLSNKTRPDIAFATGFVSRHLEKPTKKDVQTVKRVVRYLKGTSNEGITFQKSGNIHLTAYADSDFAGDLETRRSTTGYIIFLGNSPVCWASRRQQTVSVSTTEAELIAACDCVKELMYMINLLKELTDVTAQPILRVDNQGTIKLALGGSFSRRTKHIDIRYHFITEKLDEKLFKIEYIVTKEQLSDIFTKPLPRVQFDYLKYKIMQVT